MLNNFVVLLLTWGGEISSFLAENIHYLQVKTYSFYNVHFILKILVFANWAYSVQKVKKNGANDG